eukprot:7534779-Karenia_brevis.AAC.1
MHKLLGKHAKHCPHSAVGTWALGNKLEDLVQSQGDQAGTGLDGAGGGGPAEIPGEAGPGT